MRIIGLEPSRPTILCDHGAAARGSSRTLDGATPCEELLETHRCNDGRRWMTACRSSEYEDLLRTVSVCWVATVVAMFAACAHTPISVRLALEDRTTLHVGEIGALQMPSERQYMIGSAGSSLVLLKQEHQQGATVYFYRAVHTGNQTLVAAPAGLQSGQCVSCVTLHYFVTVLP